MVFQCNTCHYTTERKRNFERHCASQKHKDAVQKHKDAVYLENAKLIHAALVRNEELERELAFVKSERIAAEKKRDELRLEIKKNQL